jgi:large subunit ribosomal protein L21
MYAVIKTGGKQYRVAAGEKIKVEQIAADVGQEIVLDQVLAVGNGAGVRRNSQSHSVGTWQARQSAHFQNAPSQALSKTPRASSAVH